MSNKHDGGPAFPPRWDPKTHPSGMSLRDWFAGQALNGLIQKLPLIDRSGQFGEPLSDSEIWEFKLDVAESAYRYADAMLKAREESNDGE